MPSIINTNLNSLVSQSAMANTQVGLATTMQRLSTGLRINSAADDAAGLAISDRMNALVKGMTVAQRNTNDAISLMQVGDGAASKITDSLQRMRELAVQSANGSNNASDRANLSQEYIQLQAEITRVAQQTKFNGNLLVNSAASFTFQIGAASGDTLAVTTADLTASSGLLVDSSVSDITTQSTASLALTALDCAINAVTTQRANFGAQLNRANAIISALQTSITSQSAAKSRITDADFASETANLSRFQILQQAGNAMLAQANSQPQQVLSLLR